eukprot:TRINITY_DN10127_c0_g1_i3.p1 TRINITY_DN10127_c0_g1~~TRINITY_DN10127_c0_g1_i3.p1  ORF type:complete len:184 (+),score=29.33 TRINITY_DN10127_c0_g1_i3:63-554(+)
MCIRDSLKESEATPFEKEIDVCHSNTNEIKFGWYFNDEALLFLGHQLERCLDQSDDFSFRSRRLKLAYSCDACTLPAIISFLEKTRRRAIIDIREVNWNDLLGSVFQISDDHELTLHDSFKISLLKLLNALVRAESVAGIKYLLSHEELGCRLTKISLSLIHI